MVYLDYSATTPVLDSVLNSYIEASKIYIGNANSIHKLGGYSRSIIDEATEQIKNILNIHDYDVIYTSGATESNNTIIKSVCYTYKNRGKRILTTNLEHSSIIEVLEFMKKQGFIIDIVKTDENGIIDLDDLKNKIYDDTILVSVCSVNSETGLLQPIEEISKIVKNYNKCFFHVDMTQSIGKVKINFSNIDFVSLSAHKFYGVKGIGCLIKKKKIVIEPLIHGGKSTTKYRSGTPPLPLIIALSKALRLAYEDVDKNYNYILNLNEIIKEKLSKYDNVFINSNNKCIPHILNISILNTKPETVVHALEQYDIYISTKSACSSVNKESQAVYELTKDRKKAMSSLRISISHLTTFEDINYFLKTFDYIIKNLTK